MDVFELRRKLVQDYADYGKSFIEIQDKRIGAYVEGELQRGALWPDPLIQLNPSFEPGEWIDELVEEDVLHKSCAKVFRIKPEPKGEGKPLRLHRHQSEAIRTAQKGGNYVLTTGTGSGKSLAYIIPIVDFILKEGSGKGIRAIVVYPMNALANSQVGELEKFLCHGFPDGKGPVTFKKYTGQEDKEEKQNIIANPPDILLTNYVMLELILTRPDEKNLIQMAKGLRFLVLDELHTYRGRQGADVSLLVRRARDFFEAKDLQCVGTSATLAGSGSFEEQKAEVASVASLLFGTEVKAENVIGETLRRTTPDRSGDDPAFLSELTDRLKDQNRHPPQGFSDFIKDPLSIWLETTFGLSRAPESGRLIRTKPRSVVGETGAAKELSELTGVDLDRSISAIQEGLLAGYTCEPNPDTGFPVFAFRLHQFISRGDNVFASIETEPERYITLLGQQFVPNDRDRILLPLVFCRECGQEYYCVRVRKDKHTGKLSFEPRDLSDRATTEDSEAGYLHFSTKQPWPAEMADVLKRLPEDWLEIHKGKERVRSNRRDYLPRPIVVGPDGQETQSGLTGHYLRSPFRFCLHCGVSYGFRRRTDIGSLSSLGLGGRSTATTILSLSTIRHLRKETTLAEKARKLLSFTDNRQDASLQAGHFNDFVETGILRAALHKACASTGTEGLTHDHLAQKVFDALSLPMTMYAIDHEVKFQAKLDTERALRDVLGYRLYRDLRRGWRITSPNLEQTGLLEISYASLDEVCADSDIWKDCHPLLLDAPVETRKRIAKTLLDFMRRDLCIKVDYLDAKNQESIRQRSNQRLISPWALDENENMEYSAVLYPRSYRGKGDYRGNVFLSPRGGFGQYLRRRSTFEHPIEKISLDETQQICVQLLEALRKAGLVEAVDKPEGKDEVCGYQIPASAMRWIAGAGTQAFHDPIRVPNESDAGSKPNPFFVEYYRTLAHEAIGVEAREHTAQVQYKLRVDRENKFREGRLSILYCSPTMELGVDISELNAVNMRNVPPTPANYAQRSGRAGRSGQPALVFTYCSTGSPHDQYFFKRPYLMVHGAVVPPRIDLCNEDLVKSHVHAVWLAESGQSLGATLKDVLNVEGQDPTLNLQDLVKQSIQSPTTRAKAEQRIKRILQTLETELKHADWYTEGWCAEVLNQTVLAFDQTCNRWRGLYRAAKAQWTLQNQVIADASRSAEDKSLAKRLRAEAESQLDLLLKTENLLQSDFYSYRYFASEGFLPGYNFPRLPLSAFIPARARSRRDRDDFVSRPRFLAISEFGPQAVIYHEGSRYVINRVILPLREEQEVLTTSAKLCQSCGYLHPISEGPGPDNCQRCGVLLPQALTSLFRMQNVATKRRDKINSDEEERQRMGYEICSAVRFAEHGGYKSVRTARVLAGDGTELATILYGHAATLWRINLGWRRRTNPAERGFVLDVERGYWARNEAAEEDEAGDALSPSTKRVIPYVEDRRNCLLIEFDEKPEEAAMVSALDALKNAIQVQYQLEDNELAAEILPSRGDGKYLLFYEAAEGGAGVLRRLVEDPKSLPTVARAALALCHFDPDTGNDLRRPEGAREDCEAACYDCLMSYINQPDHKLLDRQSIRELLLLLRTSEVKTSPVLESREQHLKALLNQAGSELERNWLKYIADKDLCLPDQAQVTVKSCKTKPDFLYEEHLAAIYIDGPVHDFKERHERDLQQTSAMKDRGYTVIRFHHQESWAEKIAMYPHIFGKPS